MREFAAEASLLSAQGLRTIRTVLTKIFRGERSCDGHTAGMVQTGVAQAATRRLVELGRDVPKRHPSERRVASE